VNTRSLQVREVRATHAQLRALAARRPRQFPVLFDSAAPGALSRYSILAAWPRASLLLRGDGRLEQHGVRLGAGTFLAALDEWWRAEQVCTDSCGLPFRGGWVVFLGYELAASIESGLKLPPLARDAVCAAAIRVGGALVYDHAEQRCQLVVEAAAAGDAAGFEAALSDLREVALDPPAAPFAPGALIEQDPAEFRRAVLLAQAHIGQGDIYQANLSRSWRVRLEAGADAGLLYERLRQANAAPFAALAHIADLTLLSSSPERLVRVCGNLVETRPIAGTRSRLGTAEADPPERLELLANPKERAEHVMLIDLERNDLGRICEAGSVEVNEFMVTESYPNLHHIVSNVRGRLRTGITPGDTLRAVFPGGTITGCPKYRCMQIIAELEDGPRGAYTGSLGYLNRDGDMDFNILIRTATLRGGELHFRAGAGIVADSDWQRELAETRSKARGMLRAFGADEGVSGAAA
jgi:anthranilate synthase component 1